MSVNSEEVHGSVSEEGTGLLTRRRSSSSGDEGENVRPGQRLAYGLGHVLNDLCASMWFTYLLLFFHKVLRFDNFLSGIIMLVGQVRQELIAEGSESNYYSAFFLSRSTSQIADGLSTLFVGYFSDGDGCLSVCDRYGRRKSWHAAGTFCVLLSFPFIFVHCLGCSDADCWAQVVYYSAFVVVFQFGWAATQISHLSIIPDLTPLTSERGRLTSLRYGATVASNIAVYLVAWAFLGSAKDAGDLIGPENAADFRNIMLVVVCLGLAASICFHAVIRVPRSEENRLNAGGGGDGRGDSGGVSRMRPSDWFREPQFYQTAGVYLSTRLLVNLSQGYVPLYLQVTLQLPAASVALVPLVTFGFGFLTSMVAERLMPRVGIFGTLFTGATVAVAGCSWIQVGGVGDPFFKEYGIYCVAALVGIGGSILLITSLTLTAGLIGPNTETGAFVYGAMSLTDKFSNGLAFVLIQVLLPNICVVDC